MRRVWGKCCEQGEVHECTDTWRQDGETRNYVIVPRVSLEFLSELQYASCVLHLLNFLMYLTCPIITLLHLCLHYPVGCKSLPIKRVISSFFVCCFTWVFLFFFYINDDTTLARSHFGEGAYAIMIIIIKMILMCLVFATQLLIMAWAACWGGEVSRCQKTDSVHGTPPTCPEVSRSEEVTATYLPALCWTRGKMAQAINLEESNYVKQSEVQNICKRIRCVQYWHTLINYTVVMRLCCEGKFMFSLLKRRPFNYSLGCEMYSNFRRFALEEKRQPDENELYHRDFNSKYWTFWIW